jgi:cell division GTPase FtsZ
MPLDTNYSWYHPDTTYPGVAQKKEILGWTNEEGQAQGGKPILLGFEKNADFNRNEHHAAAQVLQNRADRIRYGLKINKVRTEHLPIVKNELNLIEQQQKQHANATIPKSEDAKKSEGSNTGGSPLSRLLKIHRDRTALGK